MAQLHHPGLHLALSALIPMAPCTWIPRCQGQLAAAAVLWWHNSTHLLQQHRQPGSHQVATAGVSHSQARR